VSTSYPVIPLRDLVVFPTTMVPLYIGRDKSVGALVKATIEKTQVLLLTQKNAKDTNPMPDDLYSIGTLCDVVQTINFPDGTVKIMVEGREAVRATNIVDDGECISAAVTPIKMKLGVGEELRASVKSIKSAFEELARLDKRISTEALAQVDACKIPVQLAYVVCANLNVKIEQKQEVLGSVQQQALLDLILGMLMGEIEVFKVEKKIQNRVKKSMEKSQKEYYLNEQMEAIQKELGTKDDVTGELEEALEKARTRGLSAEADKKVVKELKKLKQMNPISAEATVVRNFVETILSLPWNDCTEEQRDIAVAQQRLDEDHFGLEKVKDRILEQLAVLQLNPEARGTIICLAGPPGVGKTSLAKSVAEAQNRPFVRVSLGGVRDEAEITGHRRTYVGAMPGKIINAFKKAEKGNPVILLDEIDKMSSDHKGDPASAMLEVLDPSQNKTFQDHFLEVEYDLSKVLFFATANYIENIPRPLLDRMEVIRLEGYTNTEKLAIAKKYLVPKQLKEAGLGAFKVTIKDDTLQHMIEGYTREAGVRNLERTISKLARKIAKQVVSMKNLRVKSFTITKKSLLAYLGPDRYTPELISKENEIGCVNGMAWTEAGGDLLPIEVAVMPGKGTVQITGKLGEVMKESALTAVSYIRSRASLLGIDDETFQKNDLHLHFPEGAVPKDGPSAGIAITTSIVSALTKIPVKRTVAMTGEVTLRGKVLAIGGLKEKVLAAARAGVTHIICPKDNEKDLVDIPQEVRDTLDIFCASHVDEVLVRALDIKGPKELFKLTVNKERMIRSKYE